MEEKKPGVQGFVETLNKLNEAMNGPEQRTTLRIPGWLHKVLVSRAGDEHRSLNEQILHMLVQGLSHGDENTLHEAAKRVWVAALPDKDTPDRYLVSARAIEHLGDAINKYEGL